MTMRAPTPTRPDLVHQAMIAYMKSGLSPAINTLFDNIETTLDSLQVDPETPMVRFIECADSAIFGYSNQTNTCLTRLNAQFPKRPAEFELLLRKDRLLFHLLTLLDDPCNRPAALQYSTTNRVYDTHGLLGRLAQVYEDKPLNDTQKTYYASMKGVSDAETDIHLLFFHDQILSWAKKHPELVHLYRIGDHGTYKPSLPLSYRFSSAEEERLIQQIESVPSNSLLIIYMQPLRIDWERVHGLLSGRPVLLLFSSQFQFFHCLQFDSIRSLIEQKNCTYLCLNYHPCDQLSAQGFQNNWPDSYELIVSAIPSYMKVDLAELEKRLHTYFTEKKPSGTPTASAHALHQYGRAMVLKQRCQFLGSHYWPALIEQTRSSLSTPSEAPSSQKELKVALNVYETKVLNQLENVQHKRAVSAEMPYRICHICMQIIDGAHAPSVLIEQMLIRHRPEEFEPIFISTEDAVVSPTTYPIPLLVSPHSSSRGEERLTRIGDAGVEVFLNDGETQGLETAKKIASRLNEMEVDVAVFHGSSLLHKAALRLSDVPLTVLVSDDVDGDRSQADIIISSQELYTDQATEQAKAIASLERTMLQQLDS